MTSINAQQNRNPTGNNFDDHRGNFKTNASHTCPVNIVKEVNDNIPFGNLLVA